MTYKKNLFKKEKKVSIPYKIRFMIQFTISWFCTYACYPH